MIKLSKQFSQNATSAAPRNRSCAGRCPKTRRRGVAIDFLLSIGPYTGRLLNTLIKGSKALNILEIGTSYGHSTVFLAEAARATGGRVITIDCAANKHDYARKMLAKAGLAQHVEFRLGDAGNVIASLSGPFDFVLLDLWKDLHLLLRPFLP